MFLCEEITPCTALTIPSLVLRLIFRGDWSKVDPAPPPSFFYLRHANMSSMSSPVTFHVPSIAAGPSDPHSIVTACEDAELSGGGAGSEPRFVEVSLRECVFPLAVRQCAVYPLSVVPTCRVAGGSLACVFAGINMSRCRRRLTFRYIISRRHGRVGSPRPRPRHTCPPFTYLRLFNLITSSLPTPLHLCNLFAFVQSYHLLIAN